MVEAEPPTQQQLREHKKLYTYNMEENLTDVTNAFFSQVVTRKYANAASVAASNKFNETVSHSNNIMLSVSSYFDSKDTTNSNSNGYTHHYPQQLR